MKWFVKKKCYDEAIRNNEELLLDLCKKQQTIEEQQETIQNLQEDLYKSKILRKNLQAILRQYEKEKENVMYEFDIWAKRILRTMEHRGLNVGGPWDNITCISDDGHNVKGYINLMKAYADRLSADQIFDILNNKA